MANVICTITQLRVGDRFMYWARPLRVQEIQIKDKKIEVLAQDDTAHCVWTLLFEEGCKVMKVIP